MAEHEYLEQKLVTFFCKRPDDKYFRLYEPHKSLLQLFGSAQVAWKSAKTIKEWMGVDVFQQSISKTCGEGDSSAIVRRPFIKITS